MPSFYLQFCVYAIEKWPFSGTFPLIYGNPWSFYKRIHYMQAYFWSPYLSHITRSNCTFLLSVFFPSSRSHSLHILSLSFSFSLCLVLSLIIILHLCFHFFSISFSFSQMQAISPTSYKQLLSVQIVKAQKRLMA